MLTTSWVNVCHWMLSTQALRSRGNYERLAIDMCSNHCKSWRGSNSVHVITVAHGATQLQSSILTKIFSKDRGPLMTRWWYHDISSRTLQLSYESSWLSYNIFDHPSPRRDSAGVDHALPDIFLMPQARWSRGNDITIFFYVRFNYSTSHLGSVTIFSITLARDATQLESTMHYRIFFSMPQARWSRGNDIMIF